jgi:hypothetical protein
MAELLTDVAHGRLIVDQRTLRFIVRFDRNVGFFRQAWPTFHTLPRERLRTLLGTLDPQQRDRIVWEQLPERVTIFTLPRHATRLSIEQLVLRHWQDGLASELLECCQRASERLVTTQLKQCFAAFSSIHREEARQVLEGEGWVIDPSDERELLFSFIAHYTALKIFVPHLVTVFYPSFHAESELAAGLLSLLQVDVQAVLAQVRPPLAPTVDELASCTIQQEAEARELERQAYDPAELTARVLAELANLHAPPTAGETALATAAVAELMQPGGLVGKLDIVGLRALAIQLQLDIDRAALLHVDRAVRCHFQRSSYRPASSWQRFQLTWLRSREAIRKDRLNPRRQQHDAVMIARCTQRLQRHDALTTRRYLLWLVLSWLAYVLLLGWLVERCARSLRLISRWAQAIADRFELARFDRHLVRARLAQENSHLARAMVELRLARRKLLNIARREPSSASATAEALLANRYQQQQQPFGEQLAGHLALDAQQRQHLHQVIDYLVNQVSHEGHGVASALLLELESSYLAGQQALQSFAVTSWVGSLGAQPLIVALPLVTLSKQLSHLRAARERAGSLPLPYAMLEPHLLTLDAVIARVENELGSALHQGIAAAFATLAITTAHPSERLAVAAIQHQLLELLVARGYTHFSDLRDLLAKHRFKLDDFQLPQLLSGDVLARLDHALARQLPGMHRQGELYLRLFQLLSSLAFGTLPGRVVLRAVMIPLTITACAIVLLQHTVWHSILTHQGFPALLLAGSCLAGLILNIGWLRQVAWWISVRLPWALLTTVTRIVSWVPRWLWTWVGYPLIVALAVWSLSRSKLPRDVLPPWIPAEAIDVLAASGSFITTLLLIRTRMWVVISGMIADGCQTLINTITLGLLKHIYYGIIRLSTGFMAWLEGINYRVKDALRLIRGEPSPSLLFKALLGLAWFPFYYVIRCYVVLFLEPQVNPLKFPIVSISYKLVLPIYPELVSWITHYASLLMPHAPARVFANVTALFSTGIFGFLAWELKENWRLYRRNANPLLTPAVVGNHGETVVALLRPGFHSGTIPALYQRSRALAAAGTARSDYDRQVRWIKRQRQHLRDALEQFVQADLLTPLRHHAVFATTAGCVTAVEISPSSITVDCELEFVGQDRRISWRIQLQDQNGILHANLAWSPADQAYLTARQLLVLAFQIAVFYKRAGVDVSRQWIEQLLVQHHPQWATRDSQATFSVESRRVKLHMTERIARLARLRQHLPTLIGGDEHQLRLSGPGWLRDHAIAWDDFDQVYGERSNLAVAQCYLPLLGLDATHSAATSAALDPVLPSASTEPGPDPHPCSPTTLIETHESTGSQQTPQQVVGQPTDDGAAPLADSDPAPRGEL